MANTYKNAAVVLSSTGATDLYTAPANTRAIVQSVTAANIDGSDRYVTVTWYDSSASASYTLLYNALIPAGTSLNALDTPIVLEPGDIIRVQASAANTLHATASILQVDSTSQYPDGSITLQKLSDEAITTSKIANGAITSAKLAAGVLRYPNTNQVTRSTQIDVTGATTTTVLSASITPQTSASKILILVNGHGLMSGGTGDLSVGDKILRDATSIFSRTEFWYFSSTTAQFEAWHLSYVDSPSTTSSITYNYQIQTYTNRGTMGFSRGGTTSIALIEIPQ